MFNRIDLQLKPAFAVKLIIGLLGSLCIALSLSLDSQPLIQWFAASGSVLWTFLMLRKYGWLISPNSVLTISFRNGDFYFNDRSGNEHAFKPGKASLVLPSLVVLQMHQGSWWKPAAVAIIASKSVTDPGALRRFRVVLNHGRRQ